MARQIGDYILDRYPIDKQQLQQLFEQHLQTAHSATRALFLRKHLTTKQVIEDFLRCYRGVLREQLSIPEVGILLDVLDLNTVTIHEIQASEDRLKQHITALQATTLSPASLQAAYQTGQQQVVATTVALVQVNQQTQTEQKQVPRLFTEGLCKGRPLHLSTDRYFVSHGFEPHQLVDWRQALQKALAHINASASPLHPYFSGDTLLGGFRLCSICERLYSTRFSLFLLPSSFKDYVYLNVYMELGIAIGLGVPFLLIREREAKIPEILSSLTLYTHSGSFRSMRRELAGQVEEYDFGTVQFIKDATNLAEQPQYVLAAGETLEDEDFEGSIMDALTKTYTHQLEAKSLSTELKKMCGLGLQQLVHLIQTSRFALYRVDEQCSPTTFLALGISIGLNRPFLMICKADEKVPRDLQGLGIYQFANYTELEADVVEWHRSFFDHYVR